MKTLYTYQPEAEKIARVLMPGTVSHQSHNLGLQRCEPLLVIADSLCRYAKAYQKRFESPLVQDGVLADYFLDVARATKRLLDGDGALAMEMGRTTDSKDNGCTEQMLLAALSAGGFDSESLY